MSETTFDLGHRSFEVNNGQLMVSSHVTASFTSQETGLDQTYPVGGSKSSFFEQDCWVPRTSRLPISFNISFDPASRFNCDNVHNIVNTLQPSLHFAKLWQQLCFSTENDHMTMSDGLNGFISTIAFNLVNVQGRSPHLRHLYITDDTSGDVFNIRPPITMPCFQLSKIQINLCFSLPSDSQINVLKGVAPRCLKSSKDPASFIHLTDAVLRSFLCPRSGRLLGVKPTNDLPILYLADVAPSIFSKGYARHVSDRACLVEPIARFLTMFELQRNRFNEESVDKSVDDLYVESMQDRRSRIESDIWITMTNALKTVERDKALKPLSVTSDTDRPSDALNLSYNDYDDFEDFDGDLLNSKETLFQYAFEPETDYMLDTWALNGTTEYRHILTTNQPSDIIKPARNVPYTLQASIHATTETIPHEIFANTLGFPRTSDEQLLDETSFDPRDMPYHSEFVTRRWSEGTSEPYLSCDALDFAYLQRHRGHHDSASYHNLFETALPVDHDGVLALRDMLNSETAENTHPVTLETLDMLI